MGMFDTLLIDPPMNCEICDTLIESTQTKEFDSLLITYQKGDIISSSSDGIFTGELYCKNYKNHKQLQEEGMELDNINKIFIIVKYNLYLGIERSYEKANEVFLSFNDISLDHMIKELKEDLNEKYTQFKRALVILQELEGIQYKNLTKKELWDKAEEIKQKICTPPSDLIELFPLEDKKEKILFYKYLWSKKNNYDHLVYKIKRYIEEYQEILNLTKEELESKRKDKQWTAMEKEFENKLESLKKTSIHSNLIDIWKNLPFFSNELEIGRFQELVSKIDEPEVLNEVKNKEYSQELTREIIKDVRKLNKTLHLLTEQEEKLQKKFEKFYKKPEILLEKDDTQSRLYLTLYFRIRHLEVENIEKQDIYSIIMKDIQESEKNMPDNPLKSMFF